MELNNLLSVIQKIHGCTFVSFDATTMPSPGIRIVTKGVSAIVFNPDSDRSGYEAMVRRRLTSIGKDPASFVVGDLPWGERTYGPLIRHQGKDYIQIVPVRPGKAHGLIGDRIVDVECLRSVIRKDRDDPSQGLPRGSQVKIRCYSLDSIDSMRIMGERLK